MYVCIKLRTLILSLKYIYIYIHIFRSILIPKYVFQQEDFDHSQNSLVFCNYFHMVKTSWTFPHQFIISVIVLVLLTLGCSIDEALWVYLLIILGNTMNYLISNFFSSGSYIPSIYSFCPMFRCWAYIVHIPQPYL